MAEESQHIRLDRTVLSVVTREEAEKEHYWWDKTPAERLAAIEIHRQNAYGLEACQRRLQRVLEVVRRSGNEEPPLTTQDHT